MKSKLQALHNHQKVKKWTKVGHRRGRPLVLYRGGACGAARLFPAAASLSRHWCAGSLPFRNPLSGSPAGQDVDLFAKDFIFVPVHEALHWSLMVVCHPGASPLKRSPGRARL